VECGSKRDLQADHKDPRTKGGKSFWLFKEERHLAELKKCQVLCKKCHRSKTALEQEDWVRLGQRRWSKLSLSDVKAIKRELKNFKYGDFSRLGRKYGITPQSVHGIYVGRIWRRV
jgi:hypothetical protein